MKKYSLIKFIVQSSKFIFHRASFLVIIPVPRSAFLIPRSLPRSSFRVLSRVLSRVFSRILLASSFLVLTSSFSSALPHTMCIYHGQAQDQYGWPYMNNADVILKSGTNEIVRYTIDGSLAPGINFALYVSLDDGSESSSYYSKALHSGDPVEIFIRDARGEHSIMQTNIPPVGVAGETFLIDVTAATDADHDGLSDEWEQEIVNDSTNPAIASIEDVKPGDDYDGDGESNLHEFMSGNFAFLNYDYLAIEKMFSVNSRFKFELLSVPGKAYTVISRTNLVSGGWSDCPFSATETGVAGIGLIEGDGDWISFYVDKPLDTKYFGIKVK